VQRDSLGIVHPFCESEINDPDVNLVGLKAVDDSEMVRQRLEKGKWPRFHDSSSTYARSRLQLPKVYRADKDSAFFANANDCT
jgi:hypothetical protein